MKSMVNIQNYTQISLKQVNNAVCTAIITYQLGPILKLSFESPFFHSDFL